MFFGLLTSKLGGWLIVGVLVTTLVGGVALHLRATANTVAALNKQVTLLSLQAKSLQTANDALQADIADVAQAQTTANHDIDTIRSQAASDSRDLLNRTFEPSDAGVQNQINKETSDIFKRLEDESHAP
jgi:hypothetical protein